MLFEDRFNSFWCWELDYCLATGIFDFLKIFLRARDSLSHIEIKSSGNGMWSRPGGDHFTKGAFSYNAL